MQKTIQTPFYYKDGRQEGEWNVFGLKSIWGHWSKTSKTKSYNQKYF